jgi:DNA-binding transcriptional LysR family regulator
MAAIMQLMDWNDYQAFILVAQSGQISKAAKKMGVDATTVGRRIRRLETRMNTTLFEQNREGQALTEAGEKLLNSIEIMASAAEAGVQEQRKAMGPSGQLRISVAEGFGSWFLTRHIDGFANAYPNIRLDLVASSGFLSPSKREADIAVILSRPRAGHVIAQKLATYALKLYASKSYLEKHGLPQQTSDLESKHELVGYIPDLLFAPELNYLGEILPSLTPRIRSSSINAQHQLVAAGAGIGVLPCFIGDTDRNLEAVLPHVKIERNLWLVTHKDNRTLERVKAGKNWLLKITQQEAKLLNPFAS